MIPRATLLASPRAWVYAALSGALLLSGIDLEITWDSFLVPFKPQRLVWVIVACAALALVLSRWLWRQLEARRAKRRLVLPFVLGFVLLPLAGIGSHEVSPTPRRATGIAEAGEIIVGMFALVAAGAIGAVVGVWTLVLVHYVRLAEQSQSNDGPQLVSAAIAGGLLGLSSLFSVFHVLLIAFAGRLPDLIGQIAVWALWAAVWLGALIWLAIIARSRAAERRWLQRVKDGRASDYELEPLADHPEWAKLPPYFTARSYSGVLVYEPEDGEEREILGRVE